MLNKQTFPLATIAALAALLIIGAPVQAIASPATQAAADQAAVNSAVKEYEDASKQAERLEKRAADLSGKLDAALAAENEANVALKNRAAAMYRVEDTDFLAAIFTSDSLTDFMARWDLIKRIGEQDADNLSKLRTARTEAQNSAKKLIALQESQAKAVDALAKKVKISKEKLTSSKAAQQAFEARIAAAAKASADAATKRAAERNAANNSSSSSASGSKPSSKPSPESELTGTGDWNTALVSHYSKTFTGRGASGAKIGPYSMMVAHKTLPFGTLIEFKYKGKTAVASVQDRGPYTGGRVFDLGPGVVRTLDFSGVHNIDYRIISR